jgi:hypothetical protein
MKKPPIMMSLSARQEEQEENEEGEEEKEEEIEEVVFKEVRNIL